MFLQLEIITHTVGFTTKEAFHFKLQGRRQFPKSYWLKMAQLRNERGAMNRDSGFLLPPLSSCELYCCLALKGGKRACMWCFSWDLRHSAVTPICAWVYIFWEVSSQKRNKNNCFPCILNAHMPQFALIAITGIPHHLVSSPEHYTTDTS